VSFLDSLTINQKDILVSLPYRAGLFISKSDETGGDTADVQEIQVLASILTGFAQEVFGSETMQYIMSETVARKDQWPGWGNDLSAVLDECHLAVDVLREHTDEKDINAFQNQVMEIAEAVALAFREYDQVSAVEKLTMSASYGVRSLLATVINKPLPPRQEFMNISRRERKALNDLAQALGTTYG